MFCHVLIGRPILGERRFKDVVLGQGVNHPQGNPARGFDLHEGLTGREDGGAIDLTTQGELVLTVQNVIVKGDSEVPTVHRVERLPLIAEKDGGNQRVIVGAEIRNLMANLRGHRKRGILAQALTDQSLGKRQPPLVDNGFVLFLQLHKHRLLWRDLAVTAHPQLFLIAGPLQRAANETERFRVVVNVSYGHTAILV